MVCPPRQRHHRQIPANPIIWKEALQVEKKRSILTLYLLYTYYTYYILTLYLLYTYSILTLYLLYLLTYLHTYGWTEIYYLDGLYTNINEGFDHKPHVVIYTLHEGYV